MGEVTPVKIDGTYLEGGGQLLRLALSFSSLTSIPFHITDIRGKRGSNRNAATVGGMKPAHLAGATWLARASHALTEGLKVRGQELLFQPRSMNDSETVLGSGEEVDSTPVWNDVIQDGIVVRCDSYIALPSPGSILLILQAILPYVLFSSSSYSYGAAPGRPRVRVVPLRLTIEGGTNVWHSLSYVGEAVLCDHGSPPTDRC